MRDHCSRRGTIRKGRHIGSLIILSLVACGRDDFSDLKAYIENVKAQIKPSIEPLPKVKAVEPFVFNAEELRDPFVADEQLQGPGEERADTGISPDTARPKEELESYELDSLRLMGTLLQDGTMWGLIRSPDGTIHRVHAGNYMGKNYGKILKITENEIELVEIVAESPGLWHERKATLSLTEAGAAGVGATR